MTGPDMTGTDMTGTDAASTDEQLRAKFEPSELATQLGETIRTLEATEGGA